MDAHERGRLFERLGLTPHKIGTLAGVDRKTVVAVLEGSATITKAALVDEALIAAAHERGVPLPEGVTPPRLTAPRVHPSTDGEPLVEYEVGGVDGVTVVVRGPVSKQADLEASVVRLIQELNTPG